MNKIMLQKAIESELLRIAGGNLQRADFFARVNFFGRLFVIRN